MYNFGCIVELKALKALKALLFHLAIIIIHLSMTFYYWISLGQITLINIWYSLDVWGNN